jgi:hypothetical protein
MTTKPKKTRSRIKKDPGKDWPGWVDGDLFIDDHAKRKWHQVDNECTPVPARNSKII